jgi:sulfide:quinone oxidoreductase
MKTGSRGGCQSSVRSRKQKATEKYDGYSACPILTEYEKLPLTEFDYDNKPKITYPFDPAKPR